MKKNIFTLSATLEFIMFNKAYTLKNSSNLIYPVDPNQILKPSSQMNI